MPRNWLRIMRETILGLFGFQGDGRIPESGWLRWATIAVYVVFGAIVLLIAVAALSA